jgi:WD40 repeat protein
LAAIGSAKTVPIWEASSGKIVHELSTGAASFLRLKWSPNGSTIAVVDCKQIATLWDATTFQQIGELSALDRAFLDAVAEMIPDEAPFGSDTFLEWSPDSSQIALGHGFAHDSPTELMVFDARTGKALFPSLVAALQLTFHPTESLVAMNDGREIFLRDTRANRELWRSLLATSQPAGGMRTDLIVSKACKMAFSPDGRRLIASCLNEIRIWDAANGYEVLVLRDFDQDVTDVTFNRDGNTIFAGSIDGSVCAYDATPLEVRRQR